MWWENGFAKHVRMKRSGLTAGVWARDCDGSVSSNLAHDVLVHSMSKLSLTVGAPSRKQVRSCFCAPAVHKDRNICL